jgi:hypothetical protein
MRNGSCSNGAQIHPLTLSDSLQNHLLLTCRWANDGSSTHNSVSIVNSSKQPHDVRKYSRLKKIWALSYDADLKSGGEFHGCRFDVSVLPDKLEFQKAKSNALL